MKYLAIDASGDLIVAAKNEDVIITRYLKGCNTKHSLTLMPYVEECLNQSGLALNQLGFFVVVTGPGSFTGIRIGVSAVKALAFSNDKKVLPLTSFDLLAYSDNAPDNALCLIDAKHGNYYAAGYKNKKITLNACFLSKEQLEDYKDEYKFVCLDDINSENGCFKADIISGLKNAVNAKYNELTDEENVFPLYVKKSQAEEELCL